MTKNKITTTTFSITFLALTLLMVPATSGTAFANHATTVSPSGESVTAFNGNCYAFIAKNPVGSTFSSAFAEAQTKSVNGIPGHLATLSSPAEEAVVDATGANAKAWIGYTSNGAFTPGPLDANGFGWVTGEAVSYTNWAAGEPNNPAEQYVENNQSGSAWNDVFDHGFNSVVGYYVEFEGACPDVDDEVCDDSDQLCKTVVITEETPDDVITVNELIQYDFTIDLNNNDGQTWLNVTLQDHGFGADLAVGDGPVDEDDPRDVDAMTLDNLDCELTQSNNKSKKEKLDCIVDSVQGNIDEIVPEGDLEFVDGEHASVSVTAYTDINPGQGKKAEPKREYTSCGIHSPNSGAVVEYFLAGEDPEVDDPHVLATPAMYVEVYDFADLLGDCDEDGLLDGEDPEPFVFNDEDGDGVGDGNDLCPFEADLGNGFDEFGCAIPDP